MKYLRLCQAHLATSKPLDLECQTVEELACRRGGELPLASAVQSLFDVPPASVFHLNITSIIKHMLRFEPRTKRQEWPASEYEAP